MRAKNGYRHDKRRSCIGRFLKRYFAKRTCRRRRMPYLAICLAVAARSAQGQEDRTTDVVRTGYTQINDDVKPVEYSVNDGLAFFEGDICLGQVVDVREFTRRTRRMRRGDVAEAVAITGEQFRWPDGLIPFEVDPNLPNRDRVFQAISIIHRDTVLHLVDRTHQTDFIRIVDKGGCWSYVGRRGGGQDLSIGLGCSTGNLIHEIFHAAGLWHEQSREDRDSYVEIKWDKIRSGREGNFKRHVDDGDDWGRYDYGSIMHYPTTAFSIDGEPTIVPLRFGITIGQRSAPSAGDIFALDELYSGDAPSPPKSGKRVLVTRMRRLKPVMVDVERLRVVEKVLPRGYHVVWNAVPVGSDGDAGSKPMIQFHTTIVQEDDSFVRYRVSVANLGDSRVRVRVTYVTQHYKRVKG